jgi:hypothetical protein
MNIFAIAGIWILVFLVMLVTLLNRTPEDMYRRDPAFCGLLSTVFAAIISTAVCLIVYGVTH